MAAEPFTETIGGYQIQAELGSNGRSRVLYALEPETGHAVVVKCLPEDFFDDPEFKSQFEVEVLALADLEVEEVVPVYRLGEDQGRSFLVMQYLPGGTLAERIMGGPLPLETVVQITLRLAIALDAAHQIGVFHHNIKPSNVLFDHQNRAFLSDFFQVKRSTTIADRVASGIDGAPYYTSPELALGRWELDQRSDIYALGTLVYEMLAGQLPFPGTNPVSQAVQHVHAAPQNLRQLRPDLPEGVIAAVEWAMAKDPADRYRTAGEFALVLEQQAFYPELYSRQTSGPGLGAILRTIFMVLFILLAGAFGAGFFLNWHGYLPEVFAFQGYFRPTPTATATLPPPTASPTREEPPTPTPRPTATPTRPPTATQALPTPTPPPIRAAAAPAESLLGSPVLGFASQIAVIANNEIWMANLDGSGLVQLTSDGAEKSDLQWTPDGKGLIYRHEGCFRYLEISTKKFERLGCFTDFEIAPDMQEMVLGHKVILAGNRNKQWLNFFAPFDWGLLPDLSVIPQEPQKGGCPFRAGMQVQFSPFDDKMAAIFSPDMGVAQYIVRLFRRKPCGELGVDLIDEFPGARFRIRGPQGSSQMPRIFDFGWDGDSLFAVHGDYLHGYGEMVIYNRLTGRVDTLYPVQGQCCYQHIQWSPDGSYLLFVFQDARFGVGAQVYYVPFDLIANLINSRDYRNTKGVQLTPIPFPDGFFDQTIDQRVEPALRQAIP